MSQFVIVQDAFWKDLQTATGGSYLRYLKNGISILKFNLFLNRRLPNAEHSCAGHEISIFFTMRSFYLSIYEVS